jgi:hypothetical protein
VLEAVQGTPGLDVERFERDLQGPEALAAYRADWEETRTPNAYVRDLQGAWPGIGNLKQTDGLDRYAFPTLLFRGPGGEHTVPGWCAFGEYIEAMEKAVPGSTVAPRPEILPPTRPSSVGRCSRRPSSKSSVVPTPSHRPASRPTTGATAWSPSARNSPWRSEDGGKHARQGKVSCSWSNGLK